VGVFTLRKSADGKSAAESQVAKIVCLRSRLSAAGSSLERERVSWTAERVLWPKRRIILYSPHVVSFPSARWWLFVHLSSGTGQKTNGYRVCTEPRELESTRAIIILSLYRVQWQSARAAAHLASASSEITRSLTHSSWSANTLRFPKRADFVSLRLIKSLNVAPLLSVALIFVP
jgi:hypothetical protein